MNKLIQILAIGLAIVITASIGGITTTTQQQQLAYASTDEEEQEQEQEGDYTIKEIEGQTYRVYPDGKHVNTETGSCFYANEAAGTTYGSKDCKSDRLPLGGGVIMSSPE